MALVSTNALGVPRAGVINVGDVLHTITPVPVEPVTAPAPFAKPMVGVVVPVTVIGNAALTAVTPPPVPAGVAHTPSPRQKVVADALVPLLRLPTGRLPVTCEARLTFASVPPSVRLPADVTVPVNVKPFTVPVPATLVTVPPPDPAEVSSWTAPALFL